MFTCKESVFMFIFSIKCRYWQILLREICNASAHDVSLCYWLVHVYQHIQWNISCTLLKCLYFSLKKSFAANFAINSNVSFLHYFLHEEKGIVHQNMRLLVVCCSNLKFSSAEINKNDHNIIFNELTTIASIELRLFHFFFAKTSISFGLLHSYLVWLFLQNCVVFIFAITRSVKCANIIRFIAHISIKSVVSSQKKLKWYKTNKIFVFHGIK